VRIAALLLLACTAACGRGPEGQVGLLFPLSGAMAERGHEMRTAFDLALAELPEERRPGVLEADSRGSARATTMAYGELVAMGASVVLGPLTTDEVEAATLVARATRVPCVGPAATGTHAPDGDPWALRLCYSDDDAARALAGWARMTLRLERAATVVDLRSSYSLNLARAFAREFSRLNGRIVGEVTYHSGTPQVASTLDEVATLEVEVALVAGYGSDLVRMLEGSGDPRLSRLVLLGGDGWSGGGLHRACVGRVAGAYHTRHYDPASADPLVRDFQRRWLEATGQEPSDAAALTYDAARAVLQLFDAGAGGPGLRDALLGLRERPGVTGPLTLDPRGTAVRRPIHLEQVHDPAGPSIVARL
jgi:branched-chain amino acid transport system substrate-binding protein